MALWWASGGQFPGPSDVQCLFKNSLELLFDASISASGYTPSDAIDLSKIYKIFSLGVHTDTVDDDGNDDLTKQCIAPRTVQCLDNLHAINVC
jgi:L-rhamnose isomerase